MLLVVFWLNRVWFSFDNKSDDLWKSDVSRLECEIERVYYSGYGRVMMDDVCSRWRWIVWDKNGFRTLKIWFFGSGSVVNRFTTVVNRFTG